MMMKRMLHSLRHAAPTTASSLNMAIHVKSQANASSACCNLAVRRFAQTAPASQLLAIPPTASSGVRRQRIQRQLHAGSVRSMSDKVSMTFFEKYTAPDGKTVEASIGDNLLEIAQANDLELEGACEGTLACSTCHCILKKELFDKLPAPDEEELDMLDLALGLTDTSRLGCQVKVTKDFEGAIIEIPDEFNNMQ